MLGLEPYRQEEGKWDTIAVQFAFAMMGARSLDVLFGVGILLIVAAVIFLVGTFIMLLMEQTATYLGQVWRTRGVGNSRTARIIQASYISVLLAWLVSIGMYANDSLSWVVLINILSFSLMLFAFTVVTVDVIEERMEAGHPVQIPSLNINDYLPWNKQPTK